MIAHRQTPSLASIIMKLEGMKDGSFSAIQSGISAKIEEKTVEKRIVQEKAEESVEEEASAPIPDEDVLSGQVDYSEYKKDHAIVDKVKDIFHGEIVTKGG